MTTVDYVLRMWRYVWNWNLFSSFSWAYGGIHTNIFSMLPNNYFDKSWDKAGMVDAKQTFHSLMGHFFITLQLCHMCPCLELYICK